ncbi:hypothetical protein [Serratia ureilytica]|uniref:hypothetical protein n=1 Tax=Serratia ureilytica TaxID=300181 RepID=UPI001D18F115|nr:hypothetical protein [Serratia ureilytica]MCC4108858.1 hypothetical protein [Serratia ureilytica]
MKKTTLFISLIVIYGFIGYFLHLPMAKLYFYGKTLFVSDVTATVVTQFKAVGIFILCGVIILTQIVLTKKSKSLRRYVVIYSIWVGIHFVYLLFILMLKSKFLEPLNKIPMDAIALEQFNFAGPALISLALTCLSLWLVNKSGQSERNV